MKNAWTEEVDRLRAENKEFLAVCETAIGQIDQAQTIMRDNGYVIDDLSNRWQKLAFTLYNLLVETATEAEAVRDRVKGEGA
jgi:citrate synthase